VFLKHANQTDPYQICESWYTGSTSASYWSLYGNYSEDAYIINRNPVHICEDLKLYTHPNSWLRFQTSLGAFWTWPLEPCLDTGTKLWVERNSGWGSKRVLELSTCSEVDRVEGPGNSLEAITDTFLLDLFYKVPFFPQTTLTPLHCLFSILLDLQKLEIFHLLPTNVTNVLVKAKSIPA
jgi:hypothetical protein